MAFRHFLRKPVLQIVAESDARIIGAEPLGNQAWQRSRILEYVVKRQFLASP